nr:TPA_asm: ND4 [Gammarus fossarum]
MLGGFMSVFGVLMMLGVWGESMICVMVLSGVLLMSSGDSYMWKAGLSGELDYIGWSLSLLSLWVSLMAVLGSKSIKIMNYLSGFFIALNVSLLMGFMVSFYVSDFMMFYISYESCLVPIFFLILGWGYQPERAQAGIYMLFYTLFGSLPLFFFIIMGMDAGCTYMYSMLVFWGHGSFFFVFLVGAFLVKFPMYSLHLWLFKAHLEAPVGGSMVLAGVMLKLGGYGLVRFLSVWPVGVGYFSEFVLCFSLWGGFVVSLSCLRQMDMKLLIASSSVVHMSSCVGGLFVLSEWGLKGALFVMVAHGLCSSGLFFLANMVYERSCSRSLVVSKGLLSILPSMSFWWFMMLAANMAAPPSLNLVGELLLIITLASLSKYLMVVLGSMSFLGACYSLYLFSLSQHGSCMNMKSGFCGGLIIEYLVALCHWLPLNALILCLFWLV